MRILKYIDVNDVNEVEWELDRMEFRAGLSADAVWRRVTAKYGPEDERDALTPAAEPESDTLTPEFTEPISPPPNWLTSFLGMMTDEEIRNGGSVTVPDEAVSEKMRANSSYGHEPVSAYPADMTVGEMLAGLMAEAESHCIMADSMGLDHNTKSGDFRFTLQLPNGSHAHCIISKGGAAEIMNQIGAAL